MGFFESLFGGYQLQVTNFLNESDGLNLTQKVSTLIRYTLRTYPDDYNGEKLDIVKDVVRQRDPSGELVMLIGAAPLSQYVPMLLHKLPTEAKWQLQYITDSKYTESAALMNFLRYHSPSTGAVVWVRTYDSGKPSTDIHLKLYSDLVEAPLE